MNADYCVHIFLEKAKGIKTEDGHSDPVFDIECLGQSKYSEAKDDVG